MNNRKETFSFNPPASLVEEGKWSLAVTSFEAANSVFKITIENNSLSVTTPRHRRTESAEKTIDELNKLLQLRSQNEIDLHAEQGGKKRIILISDYSSASLDTFEE